MNATTTSKIACRNRWESKARQADIARPQNKKSAETAAALEALAKGLRRTAPGPAPLLGRGSKHCSVGYKSREAQVGDFSRSRNLTLARQSSCRCDRSAGHGFICSLFLDLVLRAGPPDYVFRTDEHVCVPQPLYSDAVRFATREFGVLPLQATAAGASGSAIPRCSSRRARRLRFAPSPRNSRLELSSRLRMLSGDGRSLIQRSVARILDSDGVHQCRVRSHLGNVD